VVVHLCGEVQVLIVVEVDIITMGTMKITLSLMIQHMMSLMIVKQQLQVKIRVLLALQLHQHLQQLLHPQQHHLQQHLNLQPNHIKSLSQGHDLHFNDPNFNINLDQPALHLVSKIHSLQGGIILQGLHLQGQL